MGTFVLEVLSYPMFACPVPFLHIPLIDRLEFPAFLIAFLLAIMSLFFYNYVPLQLQIQIEICLILQSNL